MGALHQGHLDLVSASKSSCDITVVSIFVNPTQFNNIEDFNRYPNTLAADLDKLLNKKVDYVFVPLRETIYPEPIKSHLDFGDLERVLEGEFRPGHFKGVANVVSKLFNIIKPHNVFFGQKDLQQVAIIRQLISDFSFDLSLEVVPTRRENDGLAMSSRNMRLSIEERRAALLLYQSMRKAKIELIAGKNWLEIKQDIRQIFELEPLAKLEYFELVHPEKFEIYGDFDATQKVSICTASYIGNVRLIDNLSIID